MKPEEKAAFEAWCITVGLVEITEDGKKNDPGYAIAQRAWEACAAYKDLVASDRLIEGKSRARSEKFVAQFGRVFDMKTRQSEEDTNRKKP